MLKSDIRHHLWLTKKSFQRKLGGKEDDCVVASDSELDAKIGLFKCIQSEGNALHRIVDQYQERICILAQEENSLGKFLKENGKHSQTTDKVMINCGKAVSYCGQTRFLIRPPLLRFFNEIEVFRRRAISDTESTITLMEKQRTEYRASLSWMKSISNILDPDSGRMLEKFRNAQSRVRQTKDKFDKLSLDCLEKIDLLAASRCNMFSHSLIAYMENLNQFFYKSVDTLKILSSTLIFNSHYDFHILKTISIKNKSSEPKNLLQTFKISENRNIDECSEVESSVINSENGCGIIQDENVRTNLVDVLDENNKNNYIKFDDSLQQPQLSLFDNPQNFLSSSFSDNISGIENSFRFDEACQSANLIKCAKNTNNSTQLENKVNSWFDLFSELDPFADPDDMTRQFGGKVADTQAA